jgi:protein O-mannosyl-transferase
MPVERSPNLERRSTFYVSSALAVLTLLLYWPVSQYKFIVVDDYEYVCQNSIVLRGLSWHGTKWAFWSMYASNWHPLTWLSHMLDCSVYGLFAGGHHLTNVFLHTANTVLLFLVLRRLTGRLWPSALVAALFAWHPLHVESVAWVCERKDVLSTFFLMLTIGAYGRYVERQTRGRFLLTLGLFLLGLTAKPMLVTLPCLLLLLDYWPLNRLEVAPGTPAATKLWLNLVLEKVPFFFVSFLGCALTVAAQSASGAVKRMDEISLAMRIANATSSYGLYLIKTVCPAHLAIFYPLPPTPPWRLFAASLLLIIGCTGCVLYWRRKFPWLVVGWLWFLGTLVPVIGLVQVGVQSMADRYTYIPSIGLFVMLAWSVDYWIQQKPAARLVAGPVAIIFLLALAFVARIQIGYWRDSIEVFRHALKITASNAFANANLSYSLAEARLGADAVPRYRTILRAQPEDARARRSLASARAETARHDSAAIELSETLKYDPQSETVHNNLGIILSEQGKLDEAMEEFAEAIQLNPKSPWPYFNQAMTLQKCGNAGEAITDYTKAVELRPVWPEALDKLAFLWVAGPPGQARDTRKAIEFATEANQITRSNSPCYLRTLSVAYAAAGSFSNAVSTGQLAQQTAQSEGFKTMAAQLEKELACYRTGKAPVVDWRKPPACVIASEKNEVQPP